MNDLKFYLWRKVDSQREGLLLGRSGNKLVASMMAGYEGNQGWINYRGLDPQFQYRGLSRKMMGVAEEYMSIFGCSKINLQIRVSNTEVISCYLKRGFKTENVVKMGKHYVPDRCLSPC